MLEQLLSCPTQAFCARSCFAEYWPWLLLSVCHNGRLPVLNCDKKIMLEHKCQQNIDMVFNSAFLTLPFGQDAMMSAVGLMFQRGCYIQLDAILNCMPCS